MNYELFTARRIAFSKQKQVLVSRPIIRIALAGVALGFMVMIIAVAVVSGFKKQIREKVIGFSAHIMVSNYDDNNSYETTPVSSDQDFINQLKKDPAIRHIQVFATKAGIAKSDENIEGIVAKGISSDFDESFFRSKIQEGKLFSLQDTVRNDSIVISRNLADKLSLKSGDPLIIYFVQQPPRARKVFISGIYQTGLEEFDNLFLLCDIRLIRRLNDWTEDQVGGFEIFLQDFNQLEQKGNEVYNMTGSYLNAETVKEIFPQIFDWLELQNVNAIIIIVLMLIVAGMNMVSALLIIILERVSMIGTLKALGAADYSIRKIFVYLAGFLIGRGLLWGNIAGISLVLLQKYTGFLKLDEKSYYLSIVPVEINWLHIISLNAGTLLVCLLMMILPTYLITRISPMKAIRYN